MPDRKLLDALHLINSITSALKNGTKHFSKSGAILRTEKEILKTLLRDEEIIIQKPNEPQRALRLLP